MILYQNPYSRAIGSSITQLAFADAVPHQPSVTAWHRRVAAIEGVQKPVPAG